MKKVDYPFFKQMLKIVSLTFLLIIFFGEFACQLKKSNFNQKFVKYSKNFQIDTFENYLKINVLENFTSSNTQTHTYFLTKNKELAKNKNFIHIPVNRVVCLSTTYIGFIEHLGKEDKIIGISGENLIYNKEIRKKIKKGEIQDIGFGENLNIEKIISLKPDVIFAYDFQGFNKEKLNKLEKLGLKVVFVNEFREANPLARAEWIKFFALFFNETKKADSLFNIVEKKYTKISSSKKNIQRPKVLTNVPFQGIWYVPGGNSFMAKFIEDAGGDYIFKYNNKVSSIPISLEEILIRKDSIDILINTGFYNRIDEIIKNYEFLEQLKCFKTKQIYNNNKRMNGTANDFFESGVFRVDLILQDLNKIFNGDTTNLFYYKKLE